MKIQELEECAELTPGMFHAYLARNGWTKVPESTTDMWINGRYSVHLEGYPEILADVIFVLVATEGRTPQAVLREINPRLREGLPTEAEIYAHRESHPDGYWLTQNAYPNRGMLRSGYFDNKRGFVMYGYDTGSTISIPDIPASWCFWPCDAHGNKVPRPRTRAEMDSAEVPK